MNKINLKSTVAIAAIMVASVSAGYAFQHNRQANAETNRLLSEMAVTAKADPAQMKEIGGLSDKASNPNERGTFTQSDFETVAKYRHHSNFEIRRFAYSTLASLRNTHFRGEATQLIQDLKTSKDAMDRDNYLVFAWKLDAPDWRAYATENLKNPRMADTAKHLLKVGSPKL